MSTNHFDAVVVGTGGVGSSALYHLATRGLKVLGIDPFPPGHSRGSSHGESRAIRKAYFEQPDYVPLLQRAYENWRSLENACGAQLLHVTGLLEVGPPAGALIQGVKTAAMQHRLDLEQIQRDVFQKRFPGFVLPEQSVAVFEPDGGYLLVEKCIESYCQLAISRGATLRTGESVIGWQQEGQHIRIVTDREVYRAERMIVAAGAWSNDLLRELGIKLTVLRKHLHWFEVPPSSYLRQAGSPVFFYETSAGYYYGFPQLNQACIKVAEHKPFETPGECVAEPLRVCRDVDPVEQSRVQDFLRSHLHDVVLRATRHCVCMYTMSPDEDFVVDVHPQSDRVCFAAGLSGHGFKFASVLGEILADLTTAQASPLPIEFLNCRRASLQA